MANFNFNKIILGGRLTADPELRQTTNGTSVASFSIAVNRRYNKDVQQAETDFFSVTAWRQTADFIARYFKKGSSICVVGNLQNRSWTDQQGVKQYRTDVVADEVLFVDSKSDNISSGEQSFSQQSTSNYQEVDTDEDLPF